MRVKAAIIIIFARLVESYLKRVVCVERLRVKLAGDIYHGMWNIVVVFEGDDRTRLDRDDVRRESEIVDNNFVTFATVKDAPREAVKNPLSTINGAFL